MIAARQAVPDRPARRGGRGSGGAQTGRDMTVDERRDDVLGAGHGRQIPAPGLVRRRAAQGPRPAILRGRRPPTEANRASTNTPAAAPATGEPAPSRTPTCGAQPRPTTTNADTEPATRAGGPQDPASCRRDHWPSTAHLRLRELMPAVARRKRRSHRDLRRCRPRIVRRHCTHATAGGLLGISPSLATHRQVLAGRPEEEGADPAAAAAGPLLRVDGPCGFGRVRARVQHGRSGVVRGPRHRSAAAGTAVTTQRYGYRIATSGTGANAAGTSAMAGTRCAAGIAAEGVAGGCSPAVASACRCCPGGRPSP